jgi:hypothetical protein
MFCSQCGKQLIPSAAFCPNCGSRVETPPQQNTYSPPPVYPPAPNAEDTLFVLKASHTLSFGNTVVCHVVFKRSWLVLAHMTVALQKRENALLTENLKAQNLGLIKRTAATMHYWGDFHKRYLAIPTEAILAEDPVNTAIRYDAISHVDYKCAYESLGNEDNSSSTINGYLHISLSSGETLKFTHQKLHSKAAQELLTGLFGQRLKYKK